MNPKDLDNEILFKSVSEILNGRDWLEFELSARRAKNPRYSLRAFARILELSPGHTSDLLKGKQPVTKSTVERLSAVSLIPTPAKSALENTLLNQLSAKTQVHCGIPPLVHLNAVERPQAKKLLNHCLDPGMRLSLHGPVGAGKTFEVRRWLSSSDVQQFFSDGVIWVDFANDESTFERLGVICETLGISSLRKDLRTPEERIRVLKTRLGSARILIIYDHVHSPEQVQELQIGGINSVCIFLTRSPIVASHLAPDSSYQLPYFNQAEALTCLNILTPGLPASYLPQVQNILQNVDYCPGLVALLCFYWRRRLEEKAVWRLENAIEDATQLTFPYSTEGNSNLGLYSEIYGRLNFRPGDIPAHLHQAFADLRAFPHSPSSFSVDAASYVAIIDKKLVGELIDSGILQSEGNGRVSIPAGIFHALKSPPPSADAKNRLMQYFQKLLSQTAEFVDPASVLLDRKNFLQAVEIALEHGFVDIAITFAKEVFWRLRAFSGETWEIQCFDRLESLVQESGDQKQFVDFLIAKGRSLSARWYDSEAIETFQRALNSADSAGYREGKLESVLGIGHKTLNFQRRQHLVEFVEGELRNLPIGLTRFLALRLVARQRSNEGQFALALPFFEEALEISEEIKSSENSIDALDCIATTKYFQNNFNSAFADWNSALSLARQKNNWDTLTKLNLNLGSAYFQLGRRTEGLPYCHEALILAERQNLTGLATRALFLLADSYFCLDLHEMALKLAEQGRQRAKELQSAYLICEFAAMLYQVLTRLKREKEAEDRLSEGLAASSTSFDYHGSYLLSIKCEWLLEIENWKHLDIQYQRWKGEFKDHAAGFLAHQLHCIGIHLAAIRQDFDVADDLIAREQMALKNSENPILLANYAWASARLAWARADKKQAFQSAQEAISKYSAENHRNRKIIESWVTSKSFSASDLSSENQ